MTVISDLTLTAADYFRFAAIAVLHLTKLDARKPTYKVLIMELIAGRSAKKIPRL